MDFSFSELILVAMIAFVVLGPEQFVEKSHKLGVFVGKLRTQFNNYKVMAQEEMVAKPSVPPSKKDDDV